MVGLRRKRQSDTARQFLKGASNEQGRDASLSTLSPASRRSGNTKSSRTNRTAATDSMTLDQSSMVDQSLMADQSSLVDPSALVNQSGESWPEDRQIVPEVQPAFTPQRPVRSSSAEEASLRERQQQRQMLRRQEYQEAQRRKGMERTQGIHTPGREKKLEAPYPFRRNTAASRSIFPATSPSRTIREFTARV